MQVAVLAKKLNADLDVMMPLVHDAIKHLRPHSSKQYNVSTVVKRLETALIPFGIRVIRSTDAGCDPLDDTYFTVMGGECRFHTGWTIPRITIDIAHHPDTARWTMTDRRVVQLTHCIGRILGHELIHRYQIIRRGNTHGDEWSHHVRVFTPIAGDRKSQADQEYHGDYDEIEAYAHDIVQEFRQRYPGAATMSPYRFKKLVYTQFLYGDDDVLKTKFRSLWFYRAVFHHNPLHPAVNTLFNKVYGWAKYAPHLAAYVP